MATPPPGANNRATYQNQGQILLTTTVGTTSTPIAVGDSSGCWFNLTIGTAPSSAGNVWLDPSGTEAVVGKGALAAAGGGSYTFNPVPWGTIYAISDNGTVTINAVGA